MARVTALKLRAREALLAAKHDRNAKKVRWWRETRDSRHADWVKAHNLYSPGSPETVKAWKLLKRARGFVAMWYAEYEKSRVALTKVRRELRSVAPPFITAKQVGLSFQYVFGAKGAVYRGAGHYTAGHRVANAVELAAEMRSDHGFHMGKGWGGLSYEVMIADDGTIGFGNPMDRKAAAVAVNNTGMVGICCPGTTGDRMTAAQKDSVRWLMDNWHTTRVPQPHRLTRPARELEWRGHREWPDQSTACPGEMVNDYREVWA